MIDELKLNTGLRRLLEHLEQLRLEFEGARPRRDPAIALKQLHFAALMMHNHGFMGLDIQDHMLTRKQTNMAWQRLPEGAYHFANQLDKDNTNE